MRVARPAPCPPTPGRLIADDDDEGGSDGREVAEVDGAGAVLGTCAVDAAMVGKDGDGMDDEDSEGERDEFAEDAADPAVDPAAVSALPAAGSALLPAVGPEVGALFMPALVSFAAVAAAAKSLVLMPAAVHASMTGSFAAVLAAAFDTLALAGRASSDSELDRESAGCIVEPCSDVGNASGLLVDNGVASSCSCCS